jgi:hypothetical protein
MNFAPSESGCKCNTYFETGKKKNILFISFKLTPKQAPNEQTPNSESGCKYKPLFC